MKCSNCGHQFFEGVFCPECGTRYVETVVNYAPQKTYEAPTPTEINQKQIEQIKQTNEAKKVLTGSMNVRGTMYDSLEKAEKAKKDHNKIEILKSKLSNTLSQQKRRELINNFENDLTTTDAIFRFEQLKEKSERKFPLSFFLYFALNILNVISFLLFFIITSLMSPDSAFYAIPVLIFFGWVLGVLIWIPWTIVSICQLCSKNFIFKIKHI